MWARDADTPEYRGRLDALDAEVADRVAVVSRR